MRRARRSCSASRDTVRDAILSPLRQLSFWKMKDRARIFGETGGNALLRGCRTRRRARDFI